MNGDALQVRDGVVKTLDEWNAGDPTVEAVEEPVVEESLKPKTKRKAKKK